MFLGANKRSCMFTSRVGIIYLGRSLDAPNLNQVLSKTRQNTFMKKFMIQMNFFTFVMILSFQTDRSWQTVLTQIRLLLEQIFGCLNIYDFYGICINLTFIMRQSWTSSYFPDFRMFLWPLNKILWAWNDGFMVIMQLMRGPHVIRDPTCGTH